MMDRQRFLTARAYGSMEATNLADLLNHEVEGPLNS